ncbi:helix-turn-helix domain-containing protein [Amycolatopsis sp. NBC_00348]|uniref:PucR family transcriptional regulator n=1 Tax=Amycolatopsis sp. NBC_00348 TaxID=2975956 RepID=UPI002E2590FB
MRSQLRSLATDAEPDENAIAEATARAVDEGVPLDELVTAHLRGTEVVHHALSTGVPAVLTLRTRLLAHTRATVEVLIRHYVAALRARERKEQDEHGTLLTILTHGAAGSVAQVRGFALVPQYVMLHLSFGPAAEPAAPPGDSRKLTRRVLAALAPTGGDHVLSSLGAAGGIVLVPARTPVDWRRWREGLRDAEKAVGITITAAAAVVRPEEVAEAVIQTAEILDVLRWFDLPAGLYRLEDVLVEYQMTRPGEARAQLASLVNALTAYPDLIETLTVYTGQENNRRRTATQLHIHPNTVDYRLRRISEITGVDLSQPTALHRITAALAAHRAESGARDRPRM